ALTCRSATAAPPGVRLPYWAAPPVREPEIEQVSHMENIRSGGCGGIGSAAVGVDPHRPAVAASRSRRLLGHFHRAQGDAAAARSRATRSALRVWLQSTIPLTPAARRCQHIARRPTKHGQNSWYSVSLPLAAGRYLAFRCRLPDCPGPRLHVAEAEVILQLETPAPGTATR